jgi:hypothetical protein
LWLSDLAFYLSTPWQDDVSLTISGCQAPYDYLNGIYSGLASESPSGYWDYDTVLRMWLSQDANGSGTSAPALTLLGVPE